MRQNSFGQSMQRCADDLCAFRRVSVDIDLPTSGRLLCNRQIERFPYVSADPELRNRRCYEAYNIQVQGLVKRLQSSKLSKIIIGISGGLDSTQALIVAARAMDVLKLPRANILAYTMPGFATTHRTAGNAKALMEAIGCSAHELDIRPSCNQMLKDIDHPYAHGEPVYDVTFENVQAGERTSHLFRLANLHNGLVLGTSDLSELALGWCTYGVGDHMSHYSINASVPKTLIQFLIRWVADTNQLGAATSGVLRSILATDFSPELIPVIRREISRRKGPRMSSVRTSFRISRFIILCDSVIYLRRSHFWLIAPGVIAASGCGLIFPRNSESNTPSPRSSTGCPALPGVFFQTSQFKTHLRAELAQSGFGRIAITARRLSRTERQRSDGLAGRDARIPEIDSKE
jgi:NAD+ synthetase